MAPQDPRSSPRKPKPTVKAVEARGQAQSTLAGNANHRRFFNDFLNHIAKEDADLSGKFGLSWESVSDAVLGDKEIWAHFATFLVEVYKIPAGLINAGKSPSKGTAVNAWSGMINQARIRTLDSENLEVKVCPRAFIIARILPRARALTRAHCALMNLTNHRACTDLF